MDSIIQFIVTNPAAAIILLVIFCLGGLVNVMIILDKRFGLFGDRKDDNQEEVLKQLKLIQSNHLHELPDMARQLSRVEDKVNTIDNRLVRVETIVNMNSK